MRFLTVGTLYPPQHLGGYELVWQGAVRALRARGHAVRVLCTDTVLHPGAPEQDADVHRHLRWLWRDHAWPRLGRAERRAIGRHDRRVLEAHVAAFAPDAIAWFPVGGLPLALLGHARPVPSAAFVHDDWPDYGARADTLGGHGDLAGRVEAWAFVSRATRAAAERVLGPLPHALVAPSGIHPDLLDPQPARPWGGRLLAPGRIDPRKGLDLAIAAVRRVPGAHLTIAGGGDERHLAELRALATGAPVTFAGPLDRAALKAAYAAADAVLFPVRWEEPWGLVPLEAMGMGRPVIASGTGGSAEHLRDGGNALLAPPDPAAWAAAVTRLAEDPALRARLAAAGALTAAEHTEDRFHDAVEAVLGDVAGPPAAAPAPSRLP